MRSTVEWMVIICMFIAIYHNWTDFPKPQRAQEVSGTLIKINSKND